MNSSLLPRRRDAVVTVPPGGGAGESVPTTEGVGMYAPWLGGVDPLLVRDVERFDPGEPPDLDSRRYARELDEVRAYGVLNGSARTDGQTATAMFWTVNPVAQMQRALGDLADRRDLDISETARAFALLDASIADGLIVVWEQKLEHLFWRPVTAIRRADIDGNPHTTADPAWAPLFTTPPYPDYPSGHAVIIGPPPGRSPSSSAAGTSGSTCRHSPRAFRPQLQQSGHAGPGDEERADLARHPRPHRNGGLQRPRAPRRRLGSGPLRRTHSARPRPLAPLTGVGREPQPGGTNPVPTGRVSLRVRRRQVASPAPGRGGWRCP